MRNVESQSGTGNRGCCGLRLAERSRGSVLSLGMGEIKPGSVPVMYSSLLGSYDLAELGNKSRIVKGKNLKLDSVRV